MDGHTFFMTHTHTHKCAHTGAPVVCRKHTSISGTYYTVPPIMLLLINTKINKHTHIHVDFLRCAWQTQPAEKEFKGIMVALGKESRTRWKSGHGRKMR